eukprot:gene12296-12432_t
MFNFREDEVPQLQDISDTLQQATGWQVRPVAGLMHPRDFLNGLAFKYFHSTQYMRHGTIGEASLGADDKLIWHLTKVYWYTVEFGVVKEGGGIKAFGSGILSSYGELEYMGQGTAELVPFDPAKVQPKMSYKDGYQKRYFVLDSFEVGWVLGWAVPDFAPGSLVGSVPGEWDGEGVVDRQRQQGGHKLL